MKRIFSASLLVLCASIAAFAQPSAKSDSAKSDSPSSSAIPTVTVTDNSTPVELARAALTALGGDKFKNLKSLALFGNANLYAPQSAQSVPGKFALVTAGDRVRLEVDASPIFKFKQIYDGRQSYSSFPGIEMPPASKFGLPVLAKYDQPGYTVSALPNDKKLRAFRITDSEGNTTDFFIDPANGRVMKYKIPYNGYLFGTENSKFQEFEGVLVPMSFSQRLATPQGVFYAEYKVKDVKVNQPLSDDVFAIQ